MLTWFVVIALIIIGLALIIIELIFVPGTTIVGIFGLICTAFAIWMSFSKFGPTAGWTVSAISGVIAGGMLIYSIRAGAWKRFALNESIDSKVNEDKPIEVDIGSQGIARSSLRPMGKADFEGNEIEVSTMGDFVDTHTPLRVIKIKNRKVFVEPIN